jgi:hypothetical protein
MMNLYRLFSRLAMTACLLAMAIPVSAADSRSTEEWQFDAAIYLWGASMEVTPQNGDTLKMSFSDIIDNLDMTFMGALNARKDKWSLLADVIYMDLSNDMEGSIDNIIPTKLDVEMEAWIVTAAGGYTLVDNGNYSLDLLAGARYLSVDVPVKFEINSQKRNVSPSRDGWDGIIGVTGKVDLADKWYMNYYLDGGTGDSKSTWQGLAGLYYQFNKLEAGFGYRYLKFNIDSSQIDDLTIKGPYAGVRFLF